MFNWEIANNKAKIEHTLTSVSEYIWINSPSTLQNNESSGTANLRQKPSTAWGEITKKMLCLFKITIR